MNKVYQQQIKENQKRFYAFVIHELALVTIEYGVFTRVVLVTPATVDGVDA